jgi:hypothetical protein
MFTMAMYDWSNEQAVKYNGFIQLVQGAVSLGLNILATWKLVDWMSEIMERIAPCIGLSLALLYHLLTFAWPFFPNKLNYNTISMLKL